jgi:hypothetical protein
MVKKSTIFLICCISVATLQAFEQGDQVVPSRDLTNSNGEQVIEGQIYSVIHINNSNKAVLKTTENFISWTQSRFIISNSDLAYFELVTDYTKYQRFVESISFGSGILMFLIFSKGFYTLS